MKQQVTLAYDLKEVSDKISKQDQEHIKNLIGINGELQKSVVSTMELKEA
jgi:CheY-specific phosphatase CheX